MLVLVGSIVVVSSWSGSAQADDSSADDSGDDEAPTVETVGEASRSVDEPRHPSGWATSVQLDQRAPGEDDVASALDEIPGASIQRDSSFGQPAYVGVRGGNPRQTATLLNGIRIGALAGRGFDFGALSSQWLSSVELYRGAAATPWGVGPLTGAVNLRTAVREEPGREAAASTTVGSFGTWGLGIHGEVAGSGGGIRVDGSWQTSRGDFAFVDNQGTDRFRINNDHRQFTLATTAGADVAGGRATGTVVYEDRERGAPGPGEFQDSFARARSATRRAIGTANWRRRGVIAGDWGALDLELATGGVFRRRTYRNPTTLLGSTPWRSTADQVSVSGVGRADAFFSFGNLLHLTLEGRRESYSTNYAAGSADDLRAERTTLALGVSDELLLFDEKLSLIGGLRVEWLTGDRSSLPFVPSAGAVWRAFEWLRLKANVARTVRPPDFDELYLKTESVRGNPDLESERALGWDAGLEVGRDAWPVRGRAVWFDSSIRRTILFLPQTAYLYRAENVREARSSGLELQLEGDFARRGFARGQYTWTDAHLVEQADVQLAGRPRHEARVAAGWDFAGIEPLDSWETLELGAEFRARSAVNLDNFGRLRNPAYGTVDLRARLAPTSRYSVGLTLSNLTDNRRIRDRLQRPLPGRAVYASFRLQDETDT